MKQIKLKKDNTYQILWADKEVNVGDKCTLKDQAELYDVVETYHDMEKDKINRNWRVGGL